MSFIFGKMKLVEGIVRKLIIYLDYTNSVTWNLVNIDTN